MSGVNKVILLGRLGKDPEVRQLEGNRKVAKFPLATSETYKDKTGQKVENTEWHSVEFWGPVVDVLERYVKKGDMLYVEGKIRTRSYEDKEGVKRFVTDIVGQNMTLLGGNGQSSNGSGTTRTNEYNQEHPAAATPWGTDMPDDDLPF
jgi:single-strand DNA-binding protein